MANQWFRLYAEFATDPKVQMMSEADQRRFIMVLCLRCSNDDVTLHDEEVAFQLRISSDEWERSKAVFLKKGLINEDNTPTAWDRRQFVSDSSAERVRRHRANKKKTAKQVCNVTETAPEADTDTDSDTSLFFTPANADVTPASQNQPESELAHPTRKGEICRRLRHEAGIASASPHQLPDDTWAQILAKRTDEEIIEFAKAKAADKPGVGLRYLAPGLLEDPKPITTGANHGRPQRRTAADQRADTIAELTGRKRREPDNTDSRTLAGEARIVG